LYRLNETSKALEAINKAKNPELKHKELKAQILYRLEKFDDSYSVYRDILKNTSDDEFEVQEQITAIQQYFETLSKRVTLNA
jgi:signal recognition particle subunit SRP72